mgnify:CR=1 FL=1
MPHPGRALICATPCIRAERTSTRHRDRPWQSLRHEVRSNGALDDARVGRVRIASRTELRLTGRSVGQRSLALDVVANPQALAVDVWPDHRYGVV